MEHEGEALGWGQALQDEVERETDLLGEHRLLRGVRVLVRSDVEVGPGAG